MNHQNIDCYTYRITWSPEDGEHVGSCSEFPSLSWLAESPELALAGIRKLVADTVSDIQGQEGKLIESQLTAQEQIKSAFAQANAICALEGFQMTPELESLQQDVINGKITLDEAVRIFIDSRRSLVNTTEQ